MATKYAKRVPWTPEQIQTLQEFADRGAKPVEVVQQFTDRHPDKVRAKYWALRNPEACKRIKQDYRTRLIYIGSQLSPAAFRQLELESERQNLSKSTIVRIAVLQYLKQTRSNL